VEPRGKLLAGGYLPSEEVTGFLGKI